MMRVMCVTGAEGGECVWGGRGLTGAGAECVWEVGGAHTCGRWSACRGGGGSHTQRVMRVCIV